MHILYEFLENEFGLVYCLIRPKKRMSIEDKFRDYFIIIIIILIDYI